MKNVILIIFLLAFTHLSLSQTNSSVILPSYLSRNYGSVQNNSLEFHEGVDVPMVAGSEIKAIESGTIVHARGTYGQSNNIQYDIFIQTSGIPTEIIGYTHIKEDTALLIIYNPSTLQYVCKGTTVNAGDPLGKVWDNNLLGTSHSHVHITERSQIPTDQNLFNETCRNPLFGVYTRSRGSRDPCLNTACLLTSPLQTSSILESLMIAQ